MFPVPIIASLEFFWVCLSVRALLGAIPDGCLGHARARLTFVLTEWRLPRKLCKQNYALPVRRLLIQKQDGHKKPSGFHDISWRHFFFRCPDDDFHDNTINTMYCIYIVRYTRYGGKSAHRRVVWSALSFTSPAGKNKEFWYRKWAGPGANQEDLHSVLYHLHPCFLDFYSFLWGHCEPVHLTKNLSNEEPNKGFLWNVSRF